MSLANWSDIIDICNNNFKQETFLRAKRKKISLSQLHKTTKAPQQEAIALK
ncbi:hypothetical protein [Ammoniphilus sp. YIM 78166]|uniref:hypothetical protein n=1 Tax=Ammoniphilus sp. YIM 78166 TaxID=1644106 RepID=UPI001431C618|nr:hypothetical protein [Ammoniphilus sp. YIM 78166]